MGTWNYSGDPNVSTRDAIRFWLGDTDVNNQLLQDAEIAYLNTQQPNDPRLAAAAGCDTLAAKYSSKANFTVGQVSKQAGAIAKAFRDQAIWLRGEVAKTASPVAGGQSVADKITLSQNPDAVPPPFSVGQIDNPLASQLDGLNDDTGDTGQP